MLVKKTRYSQRPIVDEGTGAEHQHRSVMRYATIMLLTVLRRWSILCGFVAFHVESFLSLCSRHVVLVLSSIVITSLGEERVSLYASCLFVYLACVSFCLFPLSLGVSLLHITVK